MGEIRTRKDAVSEVLDVILLLGIAVSLFSVLSIVVMSFPFNPSSPTVEIIGFTEGDNIIISHRGGDDLNLETKVIITIGNNPPIKLKASDNLSSDFIQDGVWNIGENVIINASASPFYQHLANTKVAVVVVDIESNSIIMDGKLQEGA